MAAVREARGQCRIPAAAARDMIRVIPDPPPRHRCVAQLVPTPPILELVLREEAVERVANHTKSLISRIQPLPWLNISRRRVPVAISLPHDAILTKPAALLLEIDAQRFDGRPGGFRDVEEGQG